MKRFMYVTLTLNNIFSVLICIILSLCAVIGYDVASNYISTSAVAFENPAIIIDAGHGGEDGGTVSHKGILEKDINLKIALKLNTLFKNSGYNTIMIRDSDKLIYDENSTTIRQKKSSDLHNRLDIVNSSENAILLSIHQNHYEESKYYGAQVFYSGNNTESMALAELIQSSIIKNIQPENKRQIKKTGSEIFLLNNAKIPAVMVECGFLSNLKEAELLNTEEYQNRISECIYNAVDTFINQRK